jgi:hypothetical protein
MHRNDINPLQRDHRFTAITGAILIIILMSCALGMDLPPI